MSGGNFYQPGACKRASRLVLRSFYFFHVCLSVAPHLSRAQYTSCITMQLQSTTVLTGLQYSVCLCVEPFVKATYKLEGDGSLALVAYEELRKLYCSISIAHYPNTAALARQMANGNALIQQQLYS